MKIFQNKNVLLLGLINFLLELYFISPVIVFFFNQRGLELSQILLLESIQVMVAISLEIPAGVIADKYGKKRALIAGPLAYICAYAIMMNAGSFTEFALSFALFGMGLAFLSGTMETLIYEDLKRKGIERIMNRAMGDFGFISVFALIIAPPVGSYMASDMLPRQFTFLLMLSLVFTVLALITAFFVKEFPVTHFDDRRAFRIAREGIKTLVKNRKLLRITALCILTNPFLVIILYLFQPYLRSSGIAVSSFGFIMSVAFLFSAFSQKYSYGFERLIGIRKAAFLMTVLPGIIYICMAFVRCGFLSVTLFVLLMSAMSIRDPLFAAYRNVHIEDQIRTSVLSIINLLNLFYLVFMRIVVGIIADYSIMYAFIFMGTVIILSALLFRISLKDVTGTGGAG